MLQNQSPVIDCRRATIDELKKAYYNGTPIGGITHIGTHYGPHNDEYFAGYLFQNTPEGKHRFPGIENALFGPISRYELCKRNLLGEDGFFMAMQQASILLLTGNGPLDEHDNRKEKKSCAQRVVDLLDLLRTSENRKIYGDLIQYVNYEDNNGDNLIQCLSRTQNRRLSPQECTVLRMLQTGSFAQNLKKGAEAVGNDVREQSELLKEAYRFYKNHVEQAKLFIKAEKAYDKNENMIELVIPNKQEKFILLEIKSDIPVMNKVVHNKWRDNNREKKLGVLFLHKSNGQFVLMPNSQHIRPDEMREIAKILWQAVLGVRSQKPLCFSELEKNQFNDSVPEIYFDENTGIISNGSKVDPDVPGLIGKELTINDVIKAVRVGLDTEYFPTRFATNCNLGKCAGAECPMYNFGLNRCHEVRRVKNERNGATMGTVLKRAGLLNKQS